KYSSHWHKRIKFEPVILKQMMSIIFLIQDINIEDKLNDAPDSSYGIGVFIGSMLPFILLVALAYLIYNYNKKNSNSD
ncbi:MAG: hypothetical protein KJO96_09070, partial [Winogradskyella sp.]|nr:hypothetical protein [Winogradskyella sp.]